jgi:hypothetical protein
MYIKTKFGRNPKISAVIGTSYISHCFYEYFVIPPHPVPIERDVGRSESITIANRIWISVPTWIRTSALVRHETRPIWSRSKERQSW